MGANPASGVNYRLSSWKSSAMARDPRRSGWGIQPESGEFYDAQGASQVALPLNNAPNTTLWGER